MQKNELEMVLCDKTVEEILNQISIEELKYYHIKDLMLILKNTKCDNARNVTAILLSDLYCVESIDILIDLILDKSIENKGTLIYSLENLPIKFSDLQKIFFLIYEGNFECKMAIKSLIEKHDSLLNDENTVLLLKSLQKKINIYDEELQLLTELKEFLLDNIIKG